MKYKLVFFDLDGTLLDTIEDLGEAVNHAMGLRGFPLHTLEESRQMVIAATKLKDAYSLGGKLWPT